MKNIAEKIIERIKQAESLRYDTEVAIVLGAEKQHVGPWKARGQIPWERLLEYARKSGVSLDYLVFGRGPVRVAEIGIGEDTEHYSLIEVDKALLTRVITMIDEVFEARGLQSSGKRKALLVALAYRSSARAQDSEPDRHEIEELIDLSIAEQ